MVALKFPQITSRKDRNGAGSSAGVYFGVSSAYITEVRGEDISRKACGLDEVARHTRRCRHVVGALGGPAVVYKNAVVPPDLKAGELEEAVRWQFYELDRDAYRFVYRRADLSPEGNANYVCAAVPVGLLEEFCSARNGVFTALDLRPFALWRGFRLARPGSSPCVVVASWPDGLTVVGGRSGVEFVREIPPTANIDSERARTVDYYRRAFDAADAEVVELGGEEAARAVADGCAFAPRDPAFTDVLPEAHRRVRPTEFRRPKAGEVAAAICLAAALASAAPHALAWYYRSMERDLRASALRNAQAAAEAQGLSSETAKYREWIAAVRTHRVVPYSAVLADLRAAVPIGMVLDEVEIGSVQAQVGMGQAAQQGKPAQPRTGVAGTAPQPGGGTAPQFIGSAGQAGGSVGAAWGAVTPPVAGQNTPAPPTAGQGGSVSGPGNQKAATGPGQAQPAQKTPGQPQPAQKTQPPALYTPDVLRVLGKARDPAEVGLLADNLAQLPYVSGVSVQEVAYDSGFYKFKLEAKLAWN